MSTGTRACTCLHPTLGVGRRCLNCGCRPAAEARTCRYCRRHEGDDDGDPEVSWWWEAPEVCSRCARLLDRFQARLSSQVCWAELEEPPTSDDVWQAAEETLRARWRILRGEPPPAGERGVAAWVPDSLGELTDRDREIITAAERKFDFERQRIWNDCGVDQAKVARMRDGLCDLLERCLAQLSDPALHLGELCTEVARAIETRGAHLAEQSQEGRA